MSTFQAQGTIFEFYGNPGEGTVVLYVGDREYMVNEEQVNALIETMQEELRRSKLTTAEYYTEVAERRKAEAKGSQPDVTAEEQGEAASAAAHSNTVD